MFKNARPTPAVSPSPPGRIVGIVHDLNSLRAAMELADTADAPDLVELRADGFAPNAPGRDWLRNLLRVPGLDTLCHQLGARLILTVRDPAEGGSQPWLTPAHRAELGAELAARCGPDGPALVDVELRNFHRRSFARWTTPTRPLISGNVSPRAIASFHDFHTTPPVRRLRELAGRAHARGAGIFKVATMLRGPGDLARLLEFLAAESRLPLAVMGMGGTLGRASRPVLAAAGSVLNYGFLGPAPTVSGQWHAVDLRMRIKELAPG